MGWYSGGSLSSRGRGCGAGFSWLVVAFRVGACLRTAGVGGGVGNLVLLDIFLGGGGF